MRVLTVGKSTGYASRAGMALAIALSLGQSAWAQSGTGTSLKDLGAFVGLDTRFGDMAGGFAGFAGAEAALLLKHRMYLGVRGAGLATDNARLTVPGSAANQTLGMGYGGLLIGYLMPVRCMVDVSVDALLGAGGVGAAEAGEDKNWDAIFVFEPTATLELKLARVARIGVGLSYRFIGDATVPGIPESDLRGFAGVARVRIGWF